MDGRSKRVCIHSYDLCVIEYIIHFFYPAKWRCVIRTSFQKIKNPCSTDSHNKRLDLQ